MSATAERKEIAQTILAQLGGNQFITMTGAKNLAATDFGLQFKIGSGAKNGITHVTVTLNTMDLYNVKYVKVRGSKMTTIGEDKDVYCDMLRSTFTAATGFYTSMLG